MYHQLQNQKLEKICNDFEQLWFRHYGKKAKVQFFQKYMQVQIRYLRLKGVLAC